MTSPVRLRSLALLPALLLGLVACERPSEGAQLAPSTPSPSASQPQDPAFEQSLEGIWSTGGAQGDDAQTVYAIQYQAGAGLRILRDGAWLDGTVEDVDLDNQTLAFRIDRKDGPSETATLRKVRDPTAGDGFTLRLTWAQGQTEELGFVRRLTPRDRQEITLAVSQAEQVPAVACDTDAAQGSLRATLACNRDDFAALDRNLHAQLVELSARYPDGDRTAAVVVQQLDACTTPACLREVYAKWQAYFDENYDLGDVLDYL
ncbi:hypothetical protein MNO14_04535 [Luteimonas sp. S4-F44]|uniref:hypothetical protein n=1 Tax=Luteimonas sp. S4-F44 TaxID=2925842 RepID=UPI001F53DEB7|nr:hypothetical protein [Luteimonas sp. S4-F44]UNK43359.1 hypothetical protein MNO14_04535 [Luteimonas sp. S4-F44]